MQLDSGAHAQIILSLARAGPGGRRAPARRRGARAGSLCVPGFLHIVIDFILYVTT